MRYRVVASGADREAETRPSVLSASRLQLILAVLLLLLPANLTAQDVDPENPVYNFNAVGYVYKGEFQSLRGIDFKNFIYYDFDSRGRPWATFNMRNGEFETEVERKVGKQVFRESFTSCSFRNVYFLGTNANGDERALTLFDALYIGGSSSTTSYVQVFELANRRLKVVYQLSFDTDAIRGASWHSRYDPGTKTLKIQASHYMPGDAHCCISAIDVATFRWNGEKFVRQSIKTELSDYGKRKAEEAKAKKQP